MDDKNIKFRNDRLDELKKQLKVTLSEIFQIDSPDLDFGVYRIMNQKRDEITRFMDRDLVEAVDEEFGKYGGEVRNDIIKEGAALERRIREEIAEDALAASGIKEAYLNSKLARDLNAQLLDLKKKEEDASMSDVQKEAIFAHLEEFFSRYYKDGDFLSLRRYSANEKYAVPYNGEEVLLHWANKDQYYIKTDRFLKGHGFDVGVYWVMFEVVQAEEQANAGGGKRYFVLSGGEDEVTYDETKKLLTVRFAQVPLSDEELLARFPPGGSRKNPSTDDIVGGLAAAIVAHECIPKGLKDAFELKEGDRDVNPRLRKHVLGFTKESTSDFFIHKDLGGFLRQELDFYIKNEVFRLDDLGTENEVPVERYVKRAKVFKSIANRIIDFLAQLEDFQKMLWEKKKFVLQTDYCMTIDHIPEKYYPEICAKERQVQEWKDLYGIGEGAQQTLSGGPIDVAFLKSHPYLVLDTAFFDLAFKDRLLEDLQHPDGTLVEDLDEVIGGLMIKSENWQALNLLQERYREQVKCIYIDPPYNTENDRNERKFLYQDSYDHSCWLSLLTDRVELSSLLLLKDRGIFTSSIDKNEMFGYKILLDSIFGGQNFVNSIVNVNNPKGRSDQTHLPTAHDNILFFALPEAKTYGWDPEEKVLRRYNKIDDNGNRCREIDLRKTGDADRRIDREKMFYYFYFNPKNHDFFPSHEQLSCEEYIKITPLRQDGSEGRWRWGIDTAIQNLDRLLPKLMPNRGIWSVFENDPLKDDEKVMPTSVWYEKPFNSERATEQFLDLGFTKEEFLRPKPVGLLIALLKHTTTRNDIVLDFFAGSGTTAHAVLLLNRSGEFRKYVLVENGNHFDTIMIPRIQKVTFSSNWEDGMPLDNTSGQSHIFKYMVLEQYEDTLDNIEFLDKDGQVQQTLFSVRDYMLHYFLNFETKESPCRLSVDSMATPFAYTLKVRRDSGFGQFPADRDGFREVPVDLVETFNYLLGLHVIRRITREHSGLTYRIVHGTAPDNRKITVVWRNSPKKPEDRRAELEEDATFITTKILGEFPDTAILYVNGHCFAPRAVPLEPEFKKLMGA